ncbi:MAG: NHL repeat-containing protein [Spirochaetes bacterium]|nr:NHL repeat-containing protein [Spirochaetota bacterium]MBN2769932.1 NHL repeat-containing protein [Spirochaetota bacterium]
MKKVILLFLVLSLLLGLMSCEAVDTGDKDEGIPDKTSDTISEESGSSETASRGASNGYKTWVSLVKKIPLNRFEEFKNNRSCAIAKNYDTGNLYVTGFYDEVVQVYTSSGKYVKTIEHESLSSPVDISIHQGNGDLYVLNYTSHSVSVFDKNGNFLRNFGGAGSNDENLLYPHSIYATNRIYVSDGFANRDKVNIYDKSGGFIKAFGGSGAGSGKFYYPKGVAVYGGEVYVADAFNKKIQVFSKLGSYKREFSIAGIPPDDIAIDSHMEHLYYTDYTDVIVTNLEGDYVYSWGGKAFQGGTDDIIVDSKSRLVYVTDDNYIRVYKIYNSLYW